MINLIVALKLHEVGPDNFILSGIEDDDTGKWSAAIFELTSDYCLGTTLYALDTYIFRSRASAIEELERQLEIADQTIRIMSN